MFWIFIIVVVVVLVLFFFFDSPELTIVVIFCYVMWASSAGVAMVLIDDSHARGCSVEVQASENGRQIKMVETCPDPTKKAVSGPVPIPKKTKRS